MLKSNLACSFGQRFEHYDRHGNGEKSAINPSLFMEYLDEVNSGLVIYIENLFDICV